MNKIRWNIFYTAFKQLNGKYFNSNDISKRGHISKPYCRTLLSEKRHPKMITQKMVTKIGVGIGLPFKRAQLWTKLMQQKSDKTQKSSFKAPLTIPKTHTESKSKSKPKVKPKRNAPKPKHDIPKQHVIVFYPQRVKGLSPLAIFLKQFMSNKQFSIKNLSNKTYLNKQKLHELFNGTRQTVAPLTAVRIADGLDLPLFSLYKYNHVNTIIKEEPLASFNKSQAHNTKKPKQASPNVLDYVKKLSHANQLVILTVAKRLLAYQDKSNN